MQNNAFAVIDIGSTKIATVVGDRDERGMLGVQGVGVTPSAGIDRGQVSSIAQATEAIRLSVEKAEQTSGARIVSAGVSISGGHLSSMNNRGIVAIPNAGRAISGDDTQRVIDAARTVNLKSNREMIHALPRYFIVDGQDRVSDPEGMHGQRLDVEMHIVTASVNAVQNLMKCVEGAGVQIDTVIAAPVATAQAVLEADEQREGVVVVDIGGGTTEIAIFLDGAIVHTAVLPVGGANVTRDLVVGLRCPFTVAEEVKATHGHAQPDAVASGDPVTLAAFGHEHEREVHRRLIAEIVQARIEEMLSMVMVEVKRAGHADAMSAGLVITGGSAELPGITTVAEEVTGLPARIGEVGEMYGLVENVSGPTYATTLGLLRWMTESTEPGGQPVALRMPKAPSVVGLLRGVGRFGRVFLPQ